MILFASFIEGDRSFDLSYILNDTESGDKNVLHKMSMLEKIC